MRVKEYKRTAHVAWSAAELDQTLVASGTSVQQVDASFNTTAELEIFDPLSQENDGILGTVSTPDRFHCLTWGSYGINSQKHSHGIIAGGLDNGAVCLWDANKIMNGNGNESIILEGKKHLGPVRSLEFNPFQHNVLASGGTNTDVYIWNLETGQPVEPGAKPTQSQADITGVAWNKHYSYILGCCAADGVSYVWDLRSSRPVFRINESAPVRYRGSCIAWNPESPMQLLTAFEDERFPAVQLWDLRNSHSPLKTMIGHQKGVMSVAWCQKDSDMLMTSGLDCRTVVWNPNTNDEQWPIVAEIPVTKSLNFDIQWCSRNPSLVCISAAQSLSVYSAFDTDTTPEGTNADPFAVSNEFKIQKEPKWLKRPCAATFAFGGKLIRFDQNSTDVVIETIETESDLLGRAVELKENLNGDTLYDFCNRKQTQCEDKQKQDVWAFLKTNFDPNYRLELLKLLGYTKPPVVPDTFDDVTAAPETPVAAVEGETLAENEMENLNLGEKTETTTAETIEKIDLHNFDDQVDDKIAQCLLTGDYPEAVTLCLDQNRITDALLIATLGSPQLLKDTQVKYLELKESKLNSLMSMIVTNKWTKLVSSIEITNWKEIFALICTYPNESEFVQLCDLLGDRLQNEGNGQYSYEAMLCYICAKNVTKLVQLWLGTHDVSRVDDLVDLIEHTAVLAKAAGQNQIVDVQLCEKIRRYAEMIAAQGHLGIAQDFLEKCASNDHPLQVLRDRVFQANPILDQTQQPPAFPFVPVVIAPPEPEPVLQQPTAPTQQQYNEYGQPGQQQSYGQTSQQYGGQTNNMYGGGNTAPNQYTSPPQQFSNNNFYQNQNNLQHTNSNSFQQQTMGPPPSSGFNQPMTPMPPTNNMYNATPPQNNMGINDVNSGSNLYSMGSSGMTPPPTMGGFGGDGLGEAPRPLHRPMSLSGSTDQFASFSGQQPMQPLQPSPMSIQQPPMQPSPSQPHQQLPPMPQTNYGGFGTAQQQQPGQFASVPPQQGFGMPMNGFQGQPQQAQQSQPVPEPEPEPKKPIPEKYLGLSKSFEDAVQRCSEVTSKVTKKRLDEVSKKLEGLYDGFREDNIHPQVLSYLGEYTQALDGRNYVECQRIYNTLATSSSTASISHWLGCLKNLPMLLNQNRK